MYKTALSLTAVWLSLAAAQADAALVKEFVDYKEADTALEGYLVYDDAATATRPGVMVVHEWTGLGPYERKRAEQLAQLGYVAFAADI